MASLLRLSAALLAAVLLAAAAASAAQDQQRLDRTVRYLQDVQHKDGGFGERGSNPTFSAWAALALASAGINPRDQRKKPDGTSVYTYLTRHTGGFTESTEYARVILVARAAGTSPRRFGPIDPVARLLELQRRDGGFPQPPTLPSSQINGTAYAVLALAGLKGTREQTDRALDWLLSRQGADGSWADTDQTGSVIEALNAGGRRGTSAQAKALDYLRSRQNADGGFAQREAGESSNTASTSWVVRGLVAARIQATDFRAAGTGKTPLDYLAAMQQPDGSIPYSSTERSNTIWNTTFASPALAGASFPIAAVQREEQPKTEQRSDSPTRSRGEDGTLPGAGGTADGGAGDVTAGGGGEGAPLFSQPQPGSRGQVPGGERDIERANPSIDQGTGATAGESVVGKLVGRGQLAAAGKGRSLGSAPGLRAAAAGGAAPTWLLAGIGAALVLSALGGVYLERRGNKDRT